MIIVEKPGIGDAEEITQVHRTSWHETYDGILPAQSIEELLNSSEKAQITHFRDVAMGKNQSIFCSWHEMKKELWDFVMPSK